jgi:predicted ester cyclase
MSTTTASPPESATNAELIRWAFETLNQHDVAPLRQFWNAETVERFPDRECRGTEEIAGYFEDAFAAIPDFHMEVIAIAEQGDDVFVHWKLTGTHLGTLQGLEPTGKKVVIDGMDHFVIHDGNVISNFVVFDQMQYAVQLGMLPPPDSRGDRAFKRMFNTRTKLAGRFKR